MAAFGPKKMCAETAEFSTFGAKTETDIGTKIQSTFNT